MPYDSCNQFSYADCIVSYKHIYDYLYSIYSIYISAGASPLRSPKNLKSSNTLAPLPELCSPCLSSHWRISVHGVAREPLTFCAGKVLGFSGELVTEELACGCANLARKCDGRQAAGGFGWECCRGIRGLGPRVFSWAYFYRSDSSTCFFSIEVFATLVKA